MTSDLNLKNCNMFYEFIGLFKLIIMQLVNKKSNIIMITRGLLEFSDVTPIIDNVNNYCYAWRDFLLILKLISNTNQVVIFLKVPLLCM